MCENVMHHIWAGLEEMTDSGPKLRDSAVFSVVAGASAITLIFVLSIPHTYSPVLTGDITAWVHCVGGNLISPACRLPQQQEKSTEN